MIKKILSVTFINLFLRPSETPVVYRVLVNPIVQEQERMNFPDIETSEESDNMSIENKTNPILVQLVEELKEKSRKEEAPIWRDVAERLEKPSKNWAEVNLSAIERHTEEGDTIVIPGKVLGSGYLTKNVTVGSFKFSKSAKKSIEEAGGKSITIRELADQNPKGSGVKIIG